MARSKRQGDEKTPDEALIRRIRKGDEDATELLMERYKGLVRGKARFLHMMGGDSEDMIQEGMIGLYKAIRDYDEEKQASFSTFANLCVTRQLYTAVEGANRKKHLPLNTALSLNATAQSGEEKDGGHPARLDLMRAGTGSEPETALIERESEKERLRYLEESIRTTLSPMEKKVLQYYLAGESYTSISEKIGRSRKSVDNAMQRIRVKLRPLLQEE